MTYEIRPLEGYMKSKARFERKNKSYIFELKL